MPAEMRPPALIEVGPFLFEPMQWLWIKVLFGAYVLIGLLVWFFYSKDRLERENDGRGVHHILVGLLHGILWPVYVALALFAWSA